MNENNIRLETSNKEQKNRYHRRRLMLTSNLIRFLTFTDACSVCVLVWCVWSCGRPWSVCEVVVVHYVGAGVAVTVMHVLLFVLHVSMMR